MISSMSADPKAPVVSILWRGKLFGICYTTLYKIDSRPDSVLYEFHDVHPSMLTPLNLFNFKDVSEAGEYIVDECGGSVDDLVTLLLSHIEERYISNVLLTYNKELNNGSYKH